MKRITIKAKGNGWFEGTYDGRKFAAKVYDEPSDYGIGGGRVSKLEVKRSTNWKDATVVNYDRGWDLGENEEAIWAPLVGALEKKIIATAVAS